MNLTTDKVSFLILFTISALVITGCQSSKSTNGGIGVALLKASNISSESRQKMQREIQPGMSKKEVLRIASSTEYLQDGRPSERSFKTENGTKVEVWKYAFYHKYLYVTFEDGEVSSMMSEDTKTPGEEMGY